MTPWLTATAATGYAMQATATAAGAAVIALSLPRGPKRERYGAWDAYVG